jgi:subtilisin-like proprotein convertase family protein
MQRWYRRFVTVTTACFVGWHSSAEVTRSELIFDWINRATSGFAADEQGVIDASFNLWGALLPTSEPRSISLTIARESLNNALGSAANFAYDPFGNALGATITIDSGTSFFVDPTPYENSEYALSGQPGHYNAIGGGAVGNWDLLSVAVHEVGHALGFARSFDRFASRLVPGPNQTSFIYHGEDFVANLADGGHVADDYDLMGLPGFQASERALPSPMDLAILNDSFDYENTAVFTLDTGPVALPDAASTRIALNVDEAVQIADLDVALLLHHTWDADLDVSLISPSGTRIVLSTDNGASGNDYGLTSLWTRFDDESIAYPVTTYSAPFPGSYAPEQSLAIVDGESTLGTWTLEIVDDLTGDVGTLHGFALIVTTPIAIPEPLTASLLLTGIAICWCHRRRHFDNESGNANICDSRSHRRHDSQFNMVAASPRFVCKDIRVFRSSRPNPEAEDHRPGK